jgi:hypothetical protein
VQDIPLRPVTEGPRGSVSAAVVLLVTSLLEILAMAHHPSVRTSDTAQAVRQIARFSELSAVVHGVLMAFMLLITYGFSEFALRRGLRLPLIRAGAIAYGSGVLVMLGAALVSGFIIPALVSSTPHTTTLDLQINEQLLILCGALNQAYAKFGVVAMSAGILCWSLDLTRDSGARRVVGLFGCLIGVFSIVTLMSGVIHLDVRGMGEIVAIQAAWNIAIAVLMIRRTI